MLTDVQPTEEFDEVAALQRLVDVERELLKLATNNGLACYRPHYHQHLFHSSSAKRRGLFAGNRFGKSQANAAETAAWMLGERPWYKIPLDIMGVDHLEGRNRTILVKVHHDGHPDHPLVRQGIPSHATKQLIVCTNWDKVHEIWTSRDAERPGKIWQFLPKDWAKHSSNHEGVIDEIYGANGSYLKFMSAEAYRRNKLVAESSDFDRVAFDEPGPEGLWKGCSRGLTDRMGQGDFTLTSLEEMWIYDRFTGEGTPESPCFPEEHRFHVRATIFDNPHQTDAAIKLFEADLTEDERQCRLFGLPLELSGLVYKEFRREVHVPTKLWDDWRDWHLPPKNFVMYVRVDTHPVTPHAVSFFAVGPSDIPVQCHEIWQGCGGDDLGDAINAYLATAGLFLAGIKCEPAAWIKDPSNRTVSIAKQLAAKGLMIRPGSKDLSNGILATRSAFKHTRLFINPNCKRTLWELGRYRYDPEKGAPVDENDHFMENLRRLTIDKPRWFNPDRADRAAEDETFTSLDLSIGVDISSASNAHESAL